jgi:hypothetical protein
MMRPEEEVGSAVLVEMLGGAELMRTSSLEVSEGAAELSESEGAALELSVGGELEVSAGGELEVSEGVALETLEGPALVLEGSMLEEGGNSKRSPHQLMPRRTSEATFWQLRQSNNSEPRTQ